MRIAWNEKSANCDFWFSNFSKKIFYKTKTSEKSFLVGRWPIIFVPSWSCDLFAFVCSGSCLRPVPGLIHSRSFVRPRCGLTNSLAPSHTHILTAHARVLALVCSAQAPHTLAAPPLRPAKLDEKTQTHLHIISYSAKPPIRLHFDKTLGVWGFQWNMSKTKWHLIADQIYFELVGSTEEFCFGFWWVLTRWDFVVRWKSAKWELRFLEIPNPSKKYFIRPRLSEKSFGMSCLPNFFSFGRAGPPRGVDIESTIIYHEDDRVMQKNFCFGFGRVTSRGDFVWVSGRQNAILNFLIFRNSEKVDLRFLIFQLLQKNIL